MVSQDARCSAYRYLMSLICFSYLRKSVLWESQVHKHSVTNRWHSGVLNAFSEEGRSELRVNDWEVEKVEKAERKVEERYGSVCSTCFHSLWSHTLAPPTHFHNLLSSSGHKSRLRMREGQAPGMVFDSGVGIGIKQCWSLFLLKFNIIGSLFLVPEIIIMQSCG